MRRNYFATKDIKSRKKSVHKHGKITKIKNKLGLFDELFLARLFSTTHISIYIAELITQLLESFTFSTKVRNFQF